MSFQRLFTFSTHAKVSTPAYNELNLESVQRGLTVITRLKCSSLMQYYTWGNATAMRLTIACDKNAFLLFSVTKFTPPHERYPCHHKFHTSMSSRGSNELGLIY